MIRSASRGSRLWDGTDDWEFTSAADDAARERCTRSGRTRWRRSRTRLDAALARGGLDQLVHVSDSDGTHASLRRLLCDLIEEYGSHTGHADLLREAVDGRVGEDPPPGWQPGRADRLRRCGFCSSPILTSPSAPATCPPRCGTKSPRPTWSCTRATGWNRTCSTRWMPAPRGWSPAGATTTATSCAAASPNAPTLTLGGAAIHGRARDRRLEWP